MLLSEEERLKFIRYCELESDAIGNILQEMEKLSVPEGIIKNRQALQKAYKIVAMELGLIEVMDASR